ncbi:MAG: riboflavin kinase, partial [Sutterellaceae bacterium]|nr:riboflavin kinase [Sutterellaceae bacterium]
KPTVTDKKRWLLETHIFDWKGDAYGKLIRTEFVAKIRDEKKFSGLDELTAAIHADAAKAREILGRAVNDDLASSVFAF